MKIQRNRCVLKYLWIGLVLFGSASIFAQLGRVESGTVNSPGLARNLFNDPPTRPYKVYLPPSYDSSISRYPVVYALHGWPGDENSLLGDIQSFLDSNIRQRKIGEMIVVFVNGTSRLSGGPWYLSSEVVGDFEGYITKDLVDLIDSKYRTLATRESRGLHGFSIGGWGAMHLALKFPDRFSAIVAESGLYDSRSKNNDEYERQLALAHPTNLTQFNALLSQNPPISASLQAFFCGILPNRNRPGLYSDYVYEWNNGAVAFNPSAADRCLRGDVQNGDLSRYILQSTRLRAIKVVHGKMDSVISVVEARGFTNALTKSSVPFDYQEHSGGHDHLPGLSLQFLSTNLAGARLLLAAPKLTIQPNTGSTRISFVTQPTVEYVIQSTVSLPGEWTDQTVLTGNGLSMTTELPRTASDHLFFRVTARSLQ